MTTLQRVSWIASDGFLYHKWFASIPAANDYVNELHTLGAEDIDFQDVLVPQDLVGDLVHFLNKLNNHPPEKEYGMLTPESTEPQKMRQQLANMGIVSNHALLSDEQIRETWIRRIGPIPIVELAGVERDPNGLPPEAPGAKLDAGKTMAWLCISGFSRALEKVAEVTTVGAKKYSPNGWMSVEDGEVRYMEAFGRHMIELGRGERYDADTGAMHKAQMIWNLMASLELELKGEE